ncbi:hypothetical protein TBC1_11147 [Lentimicrobium saccharophilum]|uniref:Uncharacterized protein n=1 Tax=Lentimicrobium saccharophilum TaxID=1678841 RepID=A0A0S7BZV7_9BACT|nr:hypothetical protein TBC1_11147 [Lentimicrobium saccharophilum]
MSGVRVFRCSGVQVSSTFQTGCRPSSRSLSVHPERSRRGVEGPPLVPLTEFRNPKSKIRNENLYLAGQRPADD